MNALAANPELARNFRIQLRPGRMLAVLVICAAVSVSLASYFQLSDQGSRSTQQNTFLQVVFIIQAAVLVIGGSIYCLQSVQREKDQNTFDFQRITRLTPLELAIGKVLGAPALTYLVALFLMPVALWAALLARVPVATILQMYLILFAGAVTIHSFAVLVSMILERGTSAGAMFFFLWAIGATSVDFNSAYSQGPLTIHSIGPFWAYNLISPESYSFPGYPVAPPDSPYVSGQMNDLLFGVSVPHVAVLMFLYATLTAWFLLALARNIKRDPSVYEIYRPGQAFGLALYLNFLVLAFFRWMIGTYSQPPGASGGGFWEFHPVSAGQAEGTFLAFSVAIFAVLGLALLRNRDRARRRLREFGSDAGSWWAAVWPASFLLSGMALAGAAIIIMIHAKLKEPSGWSLGLGALQVAFIAAWLARDFLYLQWMNLRRTRRPLITGIIYLVIFYVCASVALAALGLFGMQHRAVAAIFIPGAAFGLDSATWVANTAPWIGALALVFAQAFVFAWLQRREMQELAAMGPGGAPAAP